MGELCLQAQSSTQRRYCPFSLSTVRPRMVTCVYIWNSTRQACTLNEVYRHKQKQREPRMSRAPVIADVRSGKSFRAAGMRDNTRRRCKLALTVRPFPSACIRPHCLSPTGLAAACEAVASANTAASDAATAWWCRSISRTSCLTSSLSFTPGEATTDLCYQLPSRVFDVKAANHTQTPCTLGTCSLQLPDF